MRSHYSMAAGTAPRSTTHGARLSALALAALVLVLAPCGCSKSNPDSAGAQSPAAGPLASEMKQVQTAFDSAEQRRKFAVEDTLRIVSAGGYADALPQLQRLAVAPNLTPEQKQALQQLITKVEALARGRR